MKKRLAGLLAFTISLSLLPGVAVFAGSYSNTQYVRGNTTYGDSYPGSVGTYSAGSGYDSYNVLKANSSVMNTTSGTKYYYVSVAEFNYNTLTNSGFQDSANTISAGATKTVSINRNKSSYVVDYFHAARGHASNTSTSYQLDSFSFTGKQYY